MVKKQTHLVNRKRSKRFHFMLKTFSIEFPRSAYRAKYPTKSYKIQKTKPYWKFAAR